MSSEVTQKHMVTAASPQQGFPPSQELWKREVAMCILILSAPFGVKQMTRGRVAVT